MKKICSLLYILLLGASVYGQVRPLLQVTDIEDKALNSRISSCLSIVVNQINNAWSDGTDPLFPNECITPEAKESILKIWQNSSFRFTLARREFKGIITSIGYQARGVEIEMTEGGLRQGGVVDFDPDGKVAGFHFSINEAVYNAILTGNDSEEDMRRRQMILNFVEDFRTAYNRKDLPFISRMYGEDVLIITGYVYRLTGDRVKASGLSEECVQYNLYNKNEYLTRLKEVFQKNRFVNLYFEDIAVIKHPSLSNIYGVTLMQKWRSTGYNDDGWLFMAIEFRNSKEMLVHIRTWQPYFLNRKVMPREKVYQLGDFEFR